MGLSRADLIAFFETNDIPTSTQYDAFITGVPNILDDYNDSPQFTLKSDVTVLAADVQTSFTTPVDLVPALGGGITSVPIHIAMQVIFNGTPYNINTNPEVRINLSGTALFTASLRLAATLTTFSPMTPAFAFGANLDQLSDDTAIVYKNASGDPAGGDSDLRFITTYYIISL